MRSLEIIGILLLTIQLPIVPMAIIIQITPTFSEMCVVFSISLCNLPHTHIFPSFNFSISFHTQGLFNSQYHTHTHHHRRALLLRNDRRVNVNAVLLLFSIFPIVITSHFLTSLFRRFLSHFFSCYTIGIIPKCSSLKI